jgi:hypothetical protein
MAIGAIQLHDWPCWAAANEFHVKCVVQFDRRGITLIVAYNGEFRVTVGQIVNVLRVIRGRAGGSQIAVAFRARFFAGGGNVYAPAMFSVAGSAIRGARLITVVDRAVMARKTSLILNLG